MDTRRATKQIKAQYRVTVIKDRIDAGLSVTAYCEAHNIFKTSYYYRLKSIREHCIETIKPKLV